MLAANGVAPEDVIGSKPVESAYDMPASIVPVPAPVPPPVLVETEEQAYKLAENAAAAPTIPVNRKKSRRAKGLLATSFSAIGANSKVKSACCRT